MLVGFEAWHDITLETDEVLAECQEVELVALVVGDRCVATQQAFDHRRGRHVGHFGSLEPAAQEMRRGLLDVRILWRLGTATDPIENNLIERRHVISNPFAGGRERFVDALAREHLLEMRHDCSRLRTHGEARVVLQLVEKVFGSACLDLKRGAIDKFSDQRLDLVDVFLLGFLVGECFRHQPERQNFLLQRLVRCALVAPEENRQRACGWGETQQANPLVDRNQSRKDFQRILIMDSFRVSLRIARPHELLDFIERRQGVMLGQIFPREVFGAVDI